MGIKLILRFIYINFIVAKYGLDRVLLEVRWLGPLRFISYLNPFNWFYRNKWTRAQRVHLALEALGPIFIKFGQILSVRYALLPDDVIEELSKLQDRVPPFASEQSIAIIEAAYEKPITECFQEFDPIPIASASIAQVHKAKLHDDTIVAVKVLRPRVHKVVKEDIQLMYMFASFIQWVWKASRRAKPVEIVEEFEKTIYEELDLIREAANASQLRRNFEGSPELHVPKVYWPYVKHNIMVTEFVHGLPVSDVESFRERGVNLKRLAEMGVIIFFTQVFKHCYFHADLHPGNVMVEVKNPARPSFITVDFGIMGSLSPRDQQYLALNMIAFFNRDYRRVALLHIESGWVSSDTRVEEFESTIRTVCEPVFERPLREISFGKLLAKLFRTAKQFDMEIQPQLLLLQKTLLNVESLGRRLYPDLNLWKTAKPFLEDWVKEQTGVNKLIETVRERMPYWIKQFAEMPDLIYDRLKQDDIKNLQKQQNIHREQKNKSENSALKPFLYGVLVTSLAVTCFSLFASYL